MLWPCSVGAHTHSMEGAGGGMVLLDGVTEGATACMKERRPIDRGTGAGVQDDGGQSRWRGTCVGRRSHLVTGV